MIDMIVEPALTCLVVDQFDGDFDEDTGVYQGYGSAIMSNKTSYDGFFHNGMMHGKGKLCWPNGVVYDGDFNGGELSGKGLYLWPDGSTYEGHVYKGLRNGHGVFKCSKGQVYEGSWVGGRREGQGKMFYDDNQRTVYQGEWKAGLREGYGSMTYSSGNIFEGEWVAGKKCGRGAMSWKTLDEVYVGEWRDDQPHGKGEHFWGANSVTGGGGGGGRSKRAAFKQSCNFYRGDFWFGLRQGNGTFFYADGSRYTGSWVNNKKQGEGVTVDADGKIFIGFFSEDRAVYPLDPPARAACPFEEIAPQVRLYVEDVIEKTILLQGADAGSLVGVSGKLIPATNNSPERLGDTTKLVTGKTGGSKPVSRMGNSPSRVNVGSRSSRLTTTVQIPKGVKSFQYETIMDEHPAEPVKKELEKLLLQYNSYLRAIYRHLSESATKDRQKTLLVCGVSLSKVDAAVLRARSFNQRLFCAVIGRVRQFLLEIGVINSRFNFRDFALTYQEMIENRLSIIRKQQIINRFRAGDVETFLSSLQEQKSSEQSASDDRTSLRFTRVLDFPADPDIGYIGTLVEEDTTPLVAAATARPHGVLDAKLPILESEFCELLVRCIAGQTMIFSNNSNSNSTHPALHYAVAKVLAEKVEPYSSHPKTVGIPHFVRSINDPFFKEFLSKYETSVLANIWFNKVLPKSKHSSRDGDTNDTNVAQVCHAVRFFLSLRGRPNDCESSGVGIAGEDAQRAQDEGHVELGHEVNGESVFAAAVSVRHGVAVLVADLSALDMLTIWGFIEKPKRKVLPSMDPAPTTTTLATSDLALGSDESSNVNTDNNTVDQLVSESDQQQQQQNEAESTSESLDLSCLTKDIDFDDFVSLLCALAATDAWLDNSNNTVGPHADETNEELSPPNEDSYNTEQQQPREKYHSVFEIVPQKALAECDTASNPATASQQQQQQQQSQSNRGQGGLSLKLQSRLSSFFDEAISIGAFA